MKNKKTSSKVGFEQKTFNFGSWEQDLEASWKMYFVYTLGLSLDLARERSIKEITGESAKKYCDILESRGIKFKGKEILDIGSGHGTVAIEIAKRGGIVIGVEPCQSWRDISQRRANDVVKSSNVKFIDANAESLPFSDNSFDYIISLQVLEHLKCPKNAVKEIKRVLKPTGIAHISCENYLAFREEHYKIFWLPLLPKTLGKIYLKIRGRNAYFLENHVTYTTFPVLVWHFLDVDLWSQSWSEKFKFLNKYFSWLLINIRHFPKIFKVGFSHFFEHKTKT